MSDETSFATVDDLEARWHPLTDTEKDRALAILADASSLIRDECPSWADAPQATLRRITCAMVRRAMASPTGEEGIPVTSRMQTAGPYTQQVAYANPTGDLYMTRAEKRALRPPRAFERNLLEGTS
ncbi:Gp19/Gp15/Gp42 family protein [Actinobaculum sp. 352]|uniref:Gp19/Gp15/Gp42 family protein n=1 Tax=Actinobaculum sp. 352 TaxID=2490946 RepID=UPI000F7F45DC|nr:Gp19/Gp15/Gp42 family protein [Actinobaculum sp. 352]RTE47735.1 hypothetical protein EKN07_12155 [Actinobaculum sp. 352]